MQFVFGRGGAPICPLSSGILPGLYCHSTLQAPGLMFSSGSSQIANL